MTRFFRPALLLLALFAAAGCGDLLKSSPSEPAIFSSEALDGGRAFTNMLTILETGPRPSGSPGAEKAANLLQQELQAIGVEAYQQVFEHDTPVGRVTFRNVVGILPGNSDHMLIVGSHYDTKAGVSDAFVGANDSGSSSGLLLELAKVLKDQAAIDGMRPEFRFMFFDGEECMRSYGPIDGFHGSRYAAEKLVLGQEDDRVAGVIILDMIGDADLSVTLPQNGTPYLTDFVLQAAEEEGLQEHFKMWPGGIGDDHVAFLMAGMPAVDIIDFEFGSAPGLNDYWHTDQDTADKVSAESLERIGRVTIRVVNKILQKEAAADKQR